MNIYWKRVAQPIMEEEYAGLKLYSADAWPLGYFGLLQGRVWKLESCNSVLLLSFSSPSPAFFSSPDGWVREGSHPLLGALSLGSVWNSYPSLPGTPTVRTTLPSLDCCISGEEVLSSFRKEGTAAALLAHNQLFTGFSGRCGRQCP